MMVDMSVTVLVLLTVLVELAAEVGWRVAGMTVLMFIVIKSDDDGGRIMTAELGIGKPELEGFWGPGPIAVLSGQSVSPQR